MPEGMPQEILHQHGPKELPKIQLPYSTVTHMMRILVPSIDYKSSWKDKDPAGTFVLHIVDNK